MPARVVATVMLLQAYEGAQAHFCAGYLLQRSVSITVGQVRRKPGGGHATVHEEVAAGDERALGAPSAARRIAPYLIWGAATPDRRQLDHAPVSLAAGSGQLVSGERGEDNAGADRVDSRAALAPPDSLGHHPQRIPALRQLVGVEGVGHLVGLRASGSAEQLLGRASWPGPRPVRRSVRRDGVRTATR